MKLTSKGQYAIVALTYIKKKATNGDTGPVRVRDICKDEKISQHYLEQLFRKMREARLVKSIRGPGGGYILLKGNITYKDILEAVGEKISFRENISDKSEASSDAVINLNTLYKKTVEAFEGITI